MQEMRTFEVGFKHKPQTSSYEHKFSVAAETAEEAVEKARQWVMQETEKWWENYGILDAAVEAWNDDGAPEELKDTPEAELVEHYRRQVHEAWSEERERIENLHLAKVYDEGTLII